LADPTFDRARFTERLGTRVLGRHLVAHAEVESTNDAAWEALALGAPDGTVIVADAQTRGRGRAGRSWHLAPGKGLALSALLVPGGERRALGVLPLGAGLALARALDRLGARAELKWPNDLRLDGRKLAGILCETRGAGAGSGPASGGCPAAGEAVVIGVGVNVLERREDFPAELREVSTSLALAGRTLDRETVAAEFLNALEPLWATLQEGDRAAVIEAWRARADFWGRPVRARTAAGVLEGRARTLDPDGGLVLALADGREVTVVAGDLDGGAAADALPETP